MGKLRPWPENHRRNGFIFLPGRLILPAAERARKNKNTIHVPVDRFYDSKLPPRAMAIDTPFVNVWMQPKGHFLWFALRWKEEDGYESLLTDNLNVTVLISLCRCIYVKIWLEQEWAMFSFFQEQLVFFYRETRGDWWSSISCSWQKLKGSHARQQRKHLVQTR